MKYRKIIISMAALTFIFTAGLSGVQAEAMSVTEQDSVSERAILILESIEAGSYETWFKLVNPNSKLAKSISKDDFYEFIKARNLARQGEYEKSLLLYEDLKLKLNLKDKDIEKIVTSLEAQID